MTVSELVDLWSERDSRYATWRRGSLPQESIESVRSWRRKELNDLAPQDRGRLAMLVSTWMPPEPARS